MTRKLLLFTLALTMPLLFGCTESEDEKAQPLLSKIEQLCKQKQYGATLDSIVLLRERFPKAIQARRRSLVLWQEASLGMAQQDVGKTDLLLQATLDSIAKETNLYRANMLRVRRDSLQARYDALCGVVRIIRIRQKENIQP